MIDYRKLVKACIRGQVYDSDVPVLPCSNPDAPEEEDLSRNETDEFMRCCREVFEEEEETRPSVRRDLDRILAGEWAAWATPKQISQSWAEPIL